MYDEYSMGFYSIKGGNLHSLHYDKSDEVWDPSVGDSDDTEPLNGLGGADQTLPCLTDW